jgi:hypothetical protein
MSDDLLTTVLRTEISSQLERLKANIKDSKPPEVQELILAQRCLEDARMRLGVAEAFNKGFDPWTNQVEKKA